MIELNFEVMTKRFELEDEIENMLNDTGVQEELEMAIEDILMRYLGWNPLLKQVGVELTLWE